MKLDFSKTKLAFEDVFVPEWGRTVRIREMSGIARDAYDLACLKPGRGGELVFDKTNARARLVAHSMFDPATEERLVVTPEEITELGKQPARILVRLFDVAQRVSATSEASVEEMQGNSEAAPDEPSSSGSAES